MRSSRCSQHRELQSFGEGESSSRILCAPCYAVINALGFLPLRLPLPRNVQPEPRIRVIGIATQQLIERPFLTQLPDAPFPVFAEELRQVDVDATLWVRGTPYTVPWGLADKTVTVRLYHRYFEVVGPDGVVSMQRGYVKEQDKGRLQIDERHSEGMPRRPDAHGPGTARRLEDGLLMRFPGLADLVVGIKERMKSFAHLHLRTLRDLAAQYGDDAFARAAEQAMGHRAYNAFSVRRLLERQHPMPPDEPIPPLTRSRGLQELLDDVDPGSLDDYAELDDLGDDDSAGEEDRHDQQP